MRSGSARPRDLYDIVNLYRRADLRGGRGLMLPVLQRKCGYKKVAVPTLAAVAAAEKIADLRADWDAMLAHQLPVLPPVDEFMETLQDVFAWLGGAEAPQLEPVPTLRERLEPGWGPDRRGPLIPRRQDGRGTRHQYPVCPEVRNRALHGHAREHWSTRAAGVAAWLVEVATPRLPAIGPGRRLGTPAEEPEWYNGVVQRAS